MIISAISVFIAYSGQNAGTSYTVVRELSHALTRDLRYKPGLITDQGQVLTSRRWRLQITDLVDDKSHTDVLSHGLRKVGNKLVPYSLTDSQAAYVKNTNGMFAAWELPSKASAGRHLILGESLDMKQTIAFGGPFVTAASKGKPYFQMSLINAMGRGKFPNLDSGFWLRSPGERIVPVGAKVTGPSSGLFIVARKVGRRNGGWLIERYELKGGTHLQVHKKIVGTFRHETFDVLAWNSLTGDIIARSETGCVWIQANGAERRRIAIKPFSAMFSRLGVLLNKGVAETDPQVWLWTGKACRKLMDGYVAGGSTDLTTFVVENAGRAVLIRL